MLVNRFPPAMKQAIARLSAAFLKAASLKSLAMYAESEEVKRN